MSQNDTTATGRKHCQVPPEIRKWARKHCRGVRRIDRFDRENERTGRGWKIEGKTIRPRHLPDGYRLGNLTGTVDAGIIRVQIREK